MSASVAVSRVMMSLPAASAWISTPGVAASAARTPGRPAGRTWTTRLETCASGGAGAIKRPARSSRREGKSAALIGRTSHRTRRAGEHVVEPDEEPPSGDDADGDERPDHHGKQEEQQPLAAPPRTCWIVHKPSRDSALKPLRIKHVSSQHVEGAVGTYATGQPAWLHGRSVSLALLALPAAATSGNPLEHPRLAVGRLIRSDTARPLARLMSRRSARGLCWPDRN